MEMRRQLKKKKKAVSTACEERPEDFTRGEGGRSSPLTAACHCVAS